MKNRIISFLDRSSKYYNTIQISLIISFFIVGSFCRNSFGFCIVYPVICFILYWVYNDFVNNKNSKIFWGIYEALYINVGIYYIIRNIEVKLGNSLHIVIKVMIFTLIDITVMALIFYIIKGTSKPIGISAKTLLGSSSDKENDYSVEICRDKETRKPVSISTRDRFLHCLILGPTGSGKSSRVMLKMIFSDLLTPAGITMFEPKDDLAEKVYAMCKYLNANGLNKKYMYFNPALPDCPYFNILEGKEDEVIETITTTFSMLDPDSSTYFKGTNNNLLRKAIMVLKRLEAVYTDPQTGISAAPATLIKLSDILNNTNNKGKSMVQQLELIPCISESEKAQNQETVAWFMNDYYSDNSKSYNDSSGVRQQVSNLIQNKYLRKILNPENGKSDFHFDECIENGYITIVSTAQGTLRELGSYLGLFLILSYQSAIFRRKGNEHTRLPQMFYCDEFQKYANPSMEDLFTEGRSYRLGINVATQSREQIAMGGGSEGNRFLSVVSSNCRNVILFPGLSSVDAQYYSREFGDKIVQEVRYGKSKTNQSLFGGHSSSSESVQTSESTKALYSVGDLIYKTEEEITYKIMKNNNVMEARNGVTSYLDKTLNDELERLVLEFKQEQEIKQREIEQREESFRQSLYKEYLKSAGNQPNYNIGNGVSQVVISGVNSSFKPNNESPVFKTNAVVSSDTQNKDNDKISNLSGQTFIYD